MIKIEFIGNVGADANIQTYDNKEFLTFNVACNSGKDRTCWVSCSLNHSLKLKEYLVKGQTVYCEGALSTRIYVGKDGISMTGINCYINNIELIGKSPKNQGKQEQEQKQQEDTRPF